MAIPRRASASAALFFSVLMRVPKKRDLGDDLGDNSRGSNFGRPLLEEERKRRGGLFAAMFAAHRATSRAF